MKSRMLLISIIGLLWCPLLRAADPQKEFKEQIEARYKDKKVKVVIPRIIVATYQHNGIWPTDSDYHVHYDHFYQSLEMPGEYRKRNNLDERTTEEVTSGADSIDEMSAGESLQVERVAMFKRGRDRYMVDLMLRAIAAKRLATQTTISEAGYEFRKKVPYGVHFRFVFPVDVAERGDFATVIHEIAPYILPEDEYRQTQAAAAQVREAGKHVELQPGMSKEDVLKQLGAPNKSVVFGAKTILQYADMTVELEGDKLVAVKTN